MSAEDEALWRHVSGSVDPLRQAKPRVPEVGVDRAPDDLPRPRAAPALSRQSRSPERPAPDPIATAARPRVSEPPPIAAFDRKRVRSIVKGRIAIDARLDLHGARQHEAYHRLRGFLLECSGKGFATVLVVTGKGGSRPHVEDVAGYGAPERGVLRRSVPLWLEEPDMRAVVASYTTAAIKHGGEGALYIHLRKRTGK